MVSTRMGRGLAICAIAAGCAGAEKQTTLPAPGKPEIAASLPAPAHEPLAVQEVEIRGRVDRLAEALRRPSIGVIGASDVWPGTIAEELQRLLRAFVPDAVVKSYGIGGQGSADILARFERQIVKNGHNIAILSGLTIVNEIDPQAIRDNYPKMFGMAKEHGIPVIVYSVSPFGGFKKWSAGMQKKADDFDSWLRGRDDIILVDVSSLGEPAWPGGPLKLRGRFDSGDGIHPGIDGAHEEARLIFESAFRPRMD
ncbi:MAG TPA: hypothetical protein VLD37_07605 [Candidatus Bilamarchaeum sp.]|nr:hypothetical protein [Candidatus Bilamarchaeum sp.]